MNRDCEIPDQAPTLAMAGIAPIVLGSQSPQRRQLLLSLVPESRLLLLPPTDASEAGFDKLHDATAIQQRLMEIARTKNADVRRQLDSQPPARFSTSERATGTDVGHAPVSVSVDWAAVITADTVVIAGTEPHLEVLGKPDGRDWEATTRDWFLRLYSGRWHRVQTGLCCSFPDGSVEERIVSTEVEFQSVTPALLDWYLQTGEPLGKAGGYGIQARGSLFVKTIQGSLSNVIGLPLEAVWEILSQRELMRSRPDN